MGDGIFMRHTEAFERSVQEFLADAREKFPETKVTREHVIDVARAFAGNERNHFLEGAGWVNHAAVGCDPDSSSPAGELPFFYKGYIDPIWGDGVLAAADEPVIEEVHEDELNAFREKYGSGNDAPAPDVHLLCILDPYADDKPDCAWYEALCVIDGVVHAARQPMLEDALDFAAGIDDDLRVGAWLGMMEPRRILIPEAMDRVGLVRDVRLVYGSLHAARMADGRWLDLAKVVEWVERVHEGGATLDSAALDRAVSSWREGGTGQVEDALGRLFC